MQTQQRSGLAALCYQEKLYMVASLNSVRCCPETFIANIADAFEYPQGVETPDKETLISKLKSLSLQEISDLHAKIENFWNAPSNYIPDTDARMVEVGLLI